MICLWRTIKKNSNHQKIIINDENDLVTLTQHVEINTLQ